MIQRRDQTIKRALEVAREQCQGDADAYLSRLLRTLDGTLGDALAFCWGTIRQVERYANVPTLSTPRDFGLHHVEEHLLFTAANDALSHLDLEPIQQPCIEFDILVILPPKMWGGV